MTTSTYNLCLSIALFLVLVTLYHLPTPPSDCDVEAIAYDPSEFYSMGEGVSFLDEDDDLDDDDDMDDDDEMDEEGEEDKGEEEEQEEEDKETDEKKEVYIKKAVVAAEDDEDHLRQDEDDAVEDDEDRVDFAAYASPEEEKLRHSRFPPFEERIKVYMSNWYLPPCRESDKVLFNLPGDSNLLVKEQKEHVVLGIAGIPEEPQKRVFTVASEPQSGGSPFFVDEEKMLACDGSKNLRISCEDLVNSMLPILFPEEEEVIPKPVIPVESPKYVPTIVQFGDEHTTRGYAYPERKTEPEEIYPSIPIIRKFRYALTRQERESLTSESCIAGPREQASNRTGVERLEPIVWLLSVEKHYGMLNETRYLDTPWSEKKSGAVYRGGVTGSNRGYTLKLLKEMTEEERCQAIGQCRFVLNSSNSTLINAKLDSDPLKLIPKKFDGVKMFDNMYYAEQMEYKAIIMLEGNELSMGFKWALLSKSVVMSPPLLYTSWAMEELLEPWTHFVPLKEDLSDVEEKMQWILDNDEEAEKIANRGSLWMMDLVFHPDVMEENQRINEEIIRRYREHFVEAGYLK